MRQAVISSVDVVIPVYNEEERLPQSLDILQRYLNETADFSWKIIIADNGSTDATPKIANELIKKYENVSYLHIPIKGRGRALRAASLGSNADILLYSDVDLSTNLRYMQLLLDGISCGFDIAIGSRLLQASRTKRRLNREIISRGYNLLVKFLFWNRFSDAQCGFKAIKTEVAKILIPLVKNNSWFFDTELLLLAEYNKYGIFEVPVEWVEDIKSKVNIPKTVIEDLAGLLRMRFTIHKKRVC
jgi:glycosyltransferase involved in cell wall biosynthesis